MSGALRMHVRCGTMSGVNIWEPETPLNVGEARYAPGGTFGPRIQRNLQLVYVWSGQVTVWIDGRAVTVRPNEGILLLPHHRERFRFARDTATRHGWCEVLDAVVRPGAVKMLEAVSCRPHPISSRIRVLSDEALALRADVRWAARIERDHLCAAILLEFLRYAGVSDPAIRPGSSDENVPHTVGLALDVIHQEYATLGSVADIADRVGVTPQHLARLFGRYVGSRPGDYLWSRRTDRAVDLITSTGLTLGEIAAQTGFRTPFHLSRRVRRVTGSAPTELRGERARRQHT